MKNSLIAAGFLLLALLVAGLAFIPGITRGADSFSERLEGTWAETFQYKDSPRMLLLFRGKEVTLRNFFKNDVTTDYRISEVSQEGFTVYFEFTHKVKRGNGRIIDRREIFEYLYHTDQGHPMLSSRDFEYDGRGPIILTEFMRENELIDGYESEMRKTLNYRDPVPTYVEENAGGRTEDKAAPESTE
ncbi:hypothetical protein [Succinimonas amylolytica]|uniref:hypothetical protein n=1 Tax=Succinimonas amylolytica TaxID=83769 RepID=UPI0023A8A5A3